MLNFFFSSPLSFNSALYCVWSQAVQFTDPHVLLVQIFLFVQPWNYEEIYTSRKKTKKRIVDIPGLGGWGSGGAALVAESGILCYISLFILSANILLCHLKFALTPPHEYTCRTLFA